MGIVFQCLKLSAALLLFLPFIGLKRSVVPFCNLRISWVSHSRFCITRELIIFLITIATSLPRSVAISFGTGAFLALGAWLLPPPRVTVRNGLAQSFPDQSLPETLGVTLVTCAKFFTPLVGSRRFSDGYALISKTNRYSTPDKTNPVLRVFSFPRCQF